MSKRVVIFQDQLLSYSETFIKKQAEALVQWQPILLGHKYHKSSLDISTLNPTLLIPEKISKLRHLVYDVRRWYNKVDPLGLQTLAALNADLVHAHFGTSAVDIWPYVERLGLPMLVTLHGFDISIYPHYWQAGKRGKRKKRYPERLLRMAQHPKVHFLAVSTDIKRRAVEFGLPENKITVSFIGIDTEQFTSGDQPLPQRENRILYVGRLVQKKGANILLEAFDQVKKRVPDAQLILIGKGGLEIGLKKMVQDKQIAGVTFLGAQPNSEVRTQLQQCKVFCLPSIRAESGDAEGLPISILEAQASGVFVVTSSIGGMGDNLIDGETCFTFAEKDSQALAEILIQLLKDTDNYLPVISKQQQMIEQQFKLRDCTLRLEQLYDQFVKSMA